jgi:hypothetical protein
MSKTHARNVAVAVGLFFAAVTNVIAGVAAIFFGLVGSVFYARAVELFDVGIIVVGLVLLAVGIYFVRKLLILAKEK